MSIIDRLKMMRSQSRGATKEMLETLKKDEEKDSEKNSVPHSFIEG